MKISYPDHVILACILCYKLIRLGSGLNEDDAKGIIDESFVEEKIKPLFIK